MSAAILDFSKKRIKAMLQKMVSRMIQVSQQNGCRLEQWRHLAFQKRLLYLKKYDRQKINVKDNVFGHVEMVNPFRLKINYFDMPNNFVFQTNFLSLQFQELFVADSKRITLNLKGLTILSNNFIFNTNLLSVILFEIQRSTHNFLDEVKGSECRLRQTNGTIYYICDRNNNYVITLCRFEKRVNVPIENVTKVKKLNSQHLYFRCSIIFYYKRNSLCKS